MENYKTPEEMVKARKEGRKDAMKLMKKRAEKLFGRKVDWYSLKKDEMLQVALSLAEDRSLDSFINLIPQTELTTSNRTNRRLRDTWARHTEFANIIDEGTKTRASLIMKELLKTQSRSKAAKESYRKRAAMKQLQVEGVRIGQEVSEGDSDNDTTAESVNTYLHSFQGNGGITTQDITSDDAQFEEYENQTQPGNSNHSRTVIIFDESQNNRQVSLVKKTLPVLRLDQLLDRVRMSEHRVENGVLVMPNTGLARILAEEFEGHDFDVQLVGDTIRIVPTELIEATV